LDAAPIVEPRGADHTRTVYQRPGKDRGIGASRSLAREVVEKALQELWVWTGWRDPRAAT